MEDLPRVLRQKRIQVEVGDLGALDDRQAGRVVDEDDDR